MSRNLYGGSVENIDIVSEDRKVTIDSPNSDFWLVVKEVKSMKKYQSQNGLDTNSTKS